MYRRNMFVKHKKVALFLKFPPYNIIYSVIMIFSERLLEEKNKWFRENVSSYKALALYQPIF